MQIILQRSNILQKEERQGVKENRKGEGKKKGEKARQKGGIKEKI
jgi:hypothetical protein